MPFPVRAPNNEIIILGKKLRKTKYLTKKTCTYRQTHWGTNRIKHYVEVTLPYLLARLFFKNLRNYNGDKKVKKVLFLGGTTWGGCCTTTTFCWGHFFARIPWYEKIIDFFTQSCDQALDPSLPQCYAPPIQNCHFFLIWSLMSLEFSPLPCTSLSEMARPQDIPTKHFLG